MKPLPKQISTASRFANFVAVWAIRLVLTGASAANAAEWGNISDPVTSQMKPGYAGPTAGVTVDRVSGDVVMVVNDQGLWKSSDHGQTFARVDDGNIGGRCETGWALNFDGNGQRLFCFMIYGNSAMTTDGGQDLDKIQDQPSRFWRGGLGGYRQTPARLAPRE